jgi:hypothetical protein
MATAYVIGLHGQPGHGKSTVSDLIAFLAPTAHTEKAKDAFATPLREWLCNMTGLDIQKTYSLTDKMRQCPPVLDMVGVILNMALEERVQEELGIDSVTYDERELAAIELFFERFGPDCKGGSVREALQFLGTECARICIHQEFWATLARNKLRSHLESGSTLIVYDDARFIEEADMLRATKEHIRASGSIVTVRSYVVEVVRPGYVDPSTAGVHHASNERLPDDRIDYIIVNDGDKAELREKVERLWTRMLAASPTRSDPHVPFLI